MEQYLMGVSAGGLEFKAISGPMPVEILDSSIAAPDSALRLAARLGDPELLLCSVFKRAAGPGGYFVLRDGDGLLFAAMAPDNLAYACALKYFGDMVSAARYGADIYENMDGGDE